MTVRPNTRVQRTRSSPSAPHSPLTRCPLGALGFCGWRLVEKEVGRCEIV